MVWRRKQFASALALFFAFVPFSAAQSQDVSGDETGTEALGTPIGGFILYPSLTIDTEYNSNIFATDGDETDDVIFRIKPIASLESDWLNHSLQFRASAIFNQFVQNPDEDVIDYEFLSSGRLDILEDTFLFATAGVNRTHEDRTSADDVQGEEPTQYTVIGGTLDFEHRLNRVWLELGNDLKHLEYDNVDAAGGGTIDNSDRDRLEYDAGLRVGYDFNPDVGGFLQGTYGLRKYDETPDDTGTDRDAYEFGLDAGLRFDITNLLIGDVFAGYQWRFQDDDTLGNQDTYGLGANLTWFATELTSANLLASRNFQETTVAGSSSVLTTRVGLTVNHSLLDTVDLRGTLFYTNEEFEDTNRTDDTYSMGPQVIYLMNRFVHLSLGYNYEQRRSDAAGEDYKIHTVLFSTRFQY